MGKQLNMHAPGAETAMVGWGEAEEEREEWARGRKGGDTETACLLWGEMFTVKVTICLYVWDISFI